MDFLLQKWHEKYHKENAIYYDLKRGPCFGGDLYGIGIPDFYLNSKLQAEGSNLGYSYNLPNGIIYKTNEAKSYLAGSKNKWIVDEFETYFI
ncbi:hypothetical protein M0811_01876 [Anaeramoeba ignava]|uniref:Uncharacterized protein n=1 Tax=Anaeramoeba ignava TaxID=1746090 RepID=A0A9Q0LGN9_ANAIG|nr:hypothetical protein M0811_01876 [Anaeramoeba ignava]